MKAKEVMTFPVISIEPRATILQAIQIMMRRHISGLPVIDKDGSLVGMVTEGDFLRRIETGTQQPRSRWLEFLMAPGRLADEYTALSWPENRGGHDSQPVHCQRGDSHR